MSVENLLYPYFRGRIIYKVGTQSSVLITRCSYFRVPLYIPAIVANTRSGLHFLVGGGSIIKK